LENKYERGISLPTLNQELIQFLQGERIVSLITLDNKLGRPIVTNVSWLIAQEGGKTITIAIGHNASSVKNIQMNPQVILNVIGPNVTYEIVGKAQVSEIQQGTIKYRVITVQVESVEDNMFYGGKVTVVPEYTKNYNAELAQKIDSEIYGAMKLELSLEHN
jgi:hypothetical protein